MPKDHRAIGRILRNPRLWGEHYLKNRDGEARRYWVHQIDDPNVRRQTSSTSTGAIPARRSILQRWRCITHS